MLQPFSPNHYFTKFTNISILFDLISGATLINLPEIAEEPFHCIENLLIEGGIAAKKAQKVIVKIKKETNIEMFLEIVELLDKKRTYDGDTILFQNNNATDIDLKKTETKTNKQLAEIKNLISKQTPYDGPSQSAAKAEFDKLSGMRTVIEQMLVVNGIQQENAKQAVDALEPDILHETLNKAKDAFSNLKAIRSHNQMDLLIQCNIKKQSMFSSIVEVLKKGG